MYMGDIVEEGESGEIFNNPLHPYTKGLINSIPSLKGRKKKILYSIKGNVPEKNTNYSGCAYSDRCNEFIKGKCDSFAPNLIKHSRNHLVSCFIYN